MQPFSKNNFRGTITKIFDKRYGTGSKGYWELVAFSVKGRFYRTFNLWHDVDSFLGNFREGDEVIIVANEVPTKEKDKAGNEQWTYKYSVESIELADPTNIYQPNPMPQQPQSSYCNPPAEEQPKYTAANQESYNITDDDLPF